MSCICQCFGKNKKAVIFHNKPTVNEYLKIKEKVRTNYIHQFNNALHEKCDCEKFQQRRKFSTNKNHENNLIIL